MDLKASKALSPQRDAVGHDGFDGASVESWEGGRFESIIFPAPTVVSCEYLMIWLVVDLATQSRVINVTSRGLRTLP